MFRQISSLTFLLTTVATQQSLTAASAPKPKGHGEPCACDSDCDFSSWLVCRNSECVCLSPSFLYEPHRSSCVIRLGEKCFEAGALGAGYSNLPAPFIRCVAGAFCSMAAGGRCACNGYGFYEVSGATCAPKKDFGAICANSKECKSEHCEILEEGQRCGCKGGQIYDSSKDKCLSLVSSYCMKDEECVTNSICSGGKCYCNKDYAPTTSLLCALKLKVNDPCNATLPNSCNNPTLSCIRGACECASPSSQILDTESGTCRGLVGYFACSVDDDCVMGSVCDGTNNECVCGEGKVETFSGTCEVFKSYRESCTKDEECDSVGPLVCRDGLCQCRDMMTKYESESKSCRGLAGFFGCGPEVGCVLGAECIQRNPRLGPRCKCEEGKDLKDDKSCGDKS